MIISNGTILIALLVLNVLFWASHHRSLKKRYKEKLDEQAEQYVRWREIHTRRLRDSEVNIEDVVKKRVSDVLRSIQRVDRRKEM